MKEEMNQDNLCIGRFLAGDSRAFSVLVTKHKDRVFNVVYSLIGRDRESQDIVQEVFLKVYRNLRFFKKRCLFSTWLYRITVNTTYDFLRKRKNLISSEKIMDSCRAKRPDPKEVLLEKEQKEILDRALLRIPLKFKTALVLKDIEGLSYKQISEVLGCRIGTVESKIYRARQLLKKELLNNREEG